MQIKTNSFIDQGKKDVYCATWKHQNNANVRIYHIWASGTKKIYCFGVSCEFKQASKCYVSW